MLKLVCKIRRYKRVFLYAIGTTCGDGVITPTSLFRQIQAIVRSANVELISVLDAVQELFLFDRDYSCFDYVIGTAHALVPEYDTGIVISKELPYMSKLRTGEKLVKLIQIIMNHKIFFANFSGSLNQRY